jgi:hypothetical protein
MGACLNPRKRRSREAAVTWTPAEHLFLAAITQTWIGQSIRWQFGGHGSGSTSSLTLMATLMESAE